MSKKTNNNTVLNYIFWDYKQVNSLDYIDHVIYECKKYNNLAPKGNIRVSNHGKYSQFYCVTADNNIRKERYLSKKKEKHIIYALAQKRYNQLLLKELENDKKYLMKNWQIKTRGNKYRVYDLLPEALKEYVEPFYPSPEYIMRKWNNEKWNYSQYELERKTHETERGEFVRSKSEKIIADKLFTIDDIDYIYEAALYLEASGRTIYPDFIILNKRTGKIYIWEHAGMMGEHDYTTDFIKKYNDYIASGFELGINLFITFENDVYSYNTRTGNKIIEQILKD